MNTLLSDCHGNADYFITLIYTYRYISIIQASARKVYVKFSDEKPGSKAMRSSYLDEKTLGFLMKNVKLRFQ